MFIIYPIIPRHNQEILRASDIFDASYSTSLYEGQT